jgi:GNAT superfamily N-acetyltransferase
MGVKEATRGDVHAIVALVDQMTRGFTGPLPWAFDYASAYDRLLHAIGEPNETIFYSGTGFIFGVVYPLTFNRNITVASELGFFDTGGNGGALLDAFEAWAENRGASVIDLAKMSGNRDKAVARVYKSRGYQPSEIHFAKVIPK